MSINVLDGEGFYELLNHSEPGYPNHTGTILTGPVKKEK